MDEVFRALGDRSRRLLLDRLFERDGQTLRELCSHLPEMTRFGVMSHLGVLESARLLTTRKVGREKLHYLNPVPIRMVHDRWIGKFEAPIVGAMVAVRHQLEGLTMVTEAGRTSAAVAPQHVHVTWIRASADAIWQAITEGSQTVRYYYGTRVESTWEAGSDVRYTYPDGRVAMDGTVVSVEPGVSLAMSIQARWDPELIKEGPVTMTWLIEPVGDGVCKLSVIYDRMGPKTTDQFTPGIAFIAAGLKSLLETGEPLPQG